MGKRSLKVVARRNDALVRAMKAIPNNISKNASRGAARAAVKVVSSKVRSNITAVDSGRLKRSVRIGTDTRNGIPYGYVRVGSKRKNRKTKSIDDAYYAMWIEYGTKPYVIPHTRARIMAKGITKEGLKWKATGVKNPRTRMRIGNRVVTGPFKVGAKSAKPFLRPALDTERQKAINAAADYIKSKLGSMISGNMAIDKAEDVDE